MWVRYVWHEPIISIEITDFNINPPSPDRRLAERSIANNFQFHRTFPMCGANCAKSDQFNGCREMRGLFYNHRSNFKLRRKRMFQLRKLIVVVIA